MSTLRPYLVVGQVQLLDLLVGDALGQHIDAFVCEDVVGKAEVGDVHQLVHPGHNVVQQGVCKLAVPEGNPMICKKLILLREAGWQKLREGPSPKSLDSEKDLIPNILYFVAIVRFVTIYALLGQKQCFWGKDCTIT